MGTSNHRRERHEGKVDGTGIAVYRECMGIPSTVDRSHRGVQPANRGDPVSKTLQFLIVFMLMTATAWADGQAFIVATQDGKYGEALNETIISPFSEHAGVNATMTGFPGGIESLRKPDPAWDVVDLPYALHLQACEEGLLFKIDDLRLLPAPDGTLPREDFMKNALTPCGVAHVVTATVAAFNYERFTMRRPSRMKDLFNLQRYPGKRAIPKNPFPILEWALLSYDIPRADLYNLLSTDRGLNLAFSRLDDLKAQVVWVKNENQAMELLANGEASMAVANSGRLFDSAVIEGNPVALIWDNQFSDFRVWAIPRSAKNEERSREFIRYSTDAWLMAGLASYVAYGPTRHSAAAMVWTQFDTGVDMRPYMANLAANMITAVPIDYEWYTSSKERLGQLFQAWLESTGPDSLHSPATE